MSPRIIDLDARREEILAAALRAFAVQGYAGTTLKQIAQNAGLGSAAHLYYYFPKKDDLFAAVLVRYLAIDPLFEPGELDEPPDVMLERYLRRYLGQFRDLNRNLAFQLVTLEASRLLTLGLDLSAVDLTRVIDDLTAYLERQVELGQIRDVPPAHAARTILGIANFHVQTRSLPLVAPLPDDQVVRHALDILLHGLVP